MGRNEDRDLADGIKTKQLQFFPWFQMSLSQYTEKQVPRAGRFAWNEGTVGEGSVK